MSDNTMPTCHLGSLSKLNLEFYKTHERVCLGKCINACVLLALSIVVILKNHDKSNLKENELIWSQSMDIRTQSLMQGNQGGKS